MLSPVTQSSSSDGSSDSSDEKMRASSPDSDVPLMAFTPKATRKPRTKASTVRDNHLFLPVGMINMSHGIIFLVVYLRYFSLN